jgi:hypothetical protein
LEAEQLTAGGPTPNAKLNFRIPRLKGTQAQTSEANANSFASLGEGNKEAMPVQGKETKRPCQSRGRKQRGHASPGEGNKEAERHIRPQVEIMEGWSFQGKKRHIPKLASPRQETTQLFFHTLQRDARPGGKRGLMHSEVHPSFFTSLGIPAPPNKEPFRTRIWLVLVREKNSQKETLVHSKNQALPSLPLSIRITGPAEAAEVEWSPSSAWADLIQRIELELEEKILKFKFSITKKPQLEWVWQEELSRGGMECTILAYIDTGSSALSVQSKRHLHWKVLEHTSSMNNEVEFAAPAHNLLRKIDVGNMTRQAHKNRTASILASSQVARKKRFTKLDLYVADDLLEGQYRPNTHRPQGGERGPKAFI